MMRRLVSSSHARMRWTSSICATPLVSQPSSSVAASSVWCQRWLSSRGRASPLLLAVSEPSSLTPPEVRWALSRLRTALKSTTTAAGTGAQRGIRGDELRPLLRVLASYDRWQLPVNGDAVLSYTRGNDNGSNDSTMAMASDNASFITIRQASSATPKLVTGWHMFQAATLIAPSSTQRAAIAGISFNGLSEESSSYLYIPSSLFGLLNNVASSSSLDSFLYTDPSSSSSSSDDRADPLVIPPAARDLTIAVLGRDDGGISLPHGPAKEQVFQCWSARDLVPSSAIATAGYSILYIDLPELLDIAAQNDIGLLWNAPIISESTHQPIDVTRPPVTVNSNESSANDAYILHTGLTHLRNYWSQQRVKDVLEAPTAAAPADGAPPPPPSPAVDTK